MKNELYNEWVKVDTHTYHMQVKYPLPNWRSRRDCPHAHECPFAESEINKGNFAKRAKSIRLVDMPLVQLEEL